MVVHTTKMQAQTHTIRGVGLPAAKISAESADRGPSETSVRVTRSISSMRNGIDEACTSEYWQNNS